MKYSSEVQQGQLYRVNGALRARALQSACVRQGQSARLGSALALGMGKCLKCNVKEAAFLDERGKRAHCDNCKLPGAARHIRKKTKKLSAKVDITKLPSRPCVLPVKKIVFAQDTLAAVARVLWY